MRTWLCLLFTCLSSLFLIICIICLIYAFEKISYLATVDTRTCFMKREVTIKLNSSGSDENPIRAYRY